MYDKLVRDELILEPAQPSLSMVLKKKIIMKKKRKKKNKQNEKKEAIIR